MEMAFMKTISLCMIVKNEERVLRRCLDSIKGIFDEIIIVDTGSQDNTVSIAYEYTNQVYIYEWTGSFADARNFSFAKASCDYIYVADADECIDRENYDRFMSLKQVLVDEVDIVQMKYVTYSEYNTVYNFKKELRPKLFKRLRQFYWEGDVHETVRLMPVVFDSDIEIEHRPIGNHASRDIAIFEQMIFNDKPFSQKLLKMYIRELYTNGEKENYARAKKFFENRLFNENDMKEDEMELVITILVRIYRVTGNIDLMFNTALKNVIMESSSEVCCELGEYFFEKELLQEASMWYYNAAYETKPVIDIRSNQLFPYEKLAEIYRKLAKEENIEVEKLSYDASDNMDTSLDNIDLKKGALVSTGKEIDEFLKLAVEYENIAKNWVMPEEDL